MHPRDAESEEEIRKGALTMKGTLFACCQGQARRSARLHRPDLDMAIDVVDVHNRPIGITRRGDVLATKQNFRTVHAILSVRRAEDILLQFLPSNHPRSPLRFGSSVAGYVMAGESYDIAIRRKLKDELVSVQTAQLRKLAEIQMDDEGSTKFVGVYVGRVASVPKFDEDHIAGLAVLPVSTIDGLLTSAPYLFTTTFVNVYRRFRAGRKA